MRRQLQQQNPGALFLTTEREILVQTSQNLYHVHIETIQSLSASEITTVIEKIERNGTPDNRDLSGILNKNI